MVPVASLIYKDAFSLHTVAAECIARPNVKNNNLIILTKYDRNKVLYILFLQLFSNMTEELKVQHATTVTAFYMYPYTLAILRDF